MTREKEFIILIDKNRGIIYKVCNSYCNTKADRADLAQDIVYNLWKSFGSFNDEYKFSTWMYRIALNVAISFYRKEKKHPNHDSIPEKLLVFEEHYDIKIEEDKNFLLLQKFINELNEIDKAIIILYLDNKPHKEIAEITGFTETNIATKINRIKEKLRTKFKNN